MCPTVKRRAKVLLAKTSLDGHWRGPSMVAVALRNAGYEVVLAGMATADEVVGIAEQEDVDLIGLSVGGRVEIALRIVEAVRSAGLGDVPIIAGGVLAPQAKARLEAAGIPAFPPGSLMEDIVATVGRLLASPARSGG